MLHLSGESTSGFMLVLNAGDLSHRVVLWQEEFTEGEELGRLDCGHDFHSACIKQWLTIKNLCPICKITALSKTRMNEASKVAHASLY